MFTIAKARIASITPSRGYSHHDRTRTGVGVKGSGFRGL